MYVCSVFVRMVLLTLFGLMKDGGLFGISVVLISSWKRCAAVCFGVMLVGAF